MPYLDVKVSVSLTTEAAARIAEALTDLTVALLEKRRELTSIALESVKASHWFVGGEAIGSQQRNTMSLKIHITEGTNTESEKAVFIQRAYDALQLIPGNLHSASYILGASKN